MNDHSIAGPGLLAWWEVTLILLLLHGLFFAIRSIRSFIGSMMYAMVFWWVGGWWHIVCIRSFVAFCCILPYQVYTPLRGEWMR